MLFSHQLRSKLGALDTMKNDPVFGALIAHILAHTRGGEGAKQVLLEGRRLYNAPRNSLIVGLQETLSSAAGAATKRREAVKVLDRIVEDLQLQHGQVLTEFTKIKAKLLDARMDI